MHLIASHRSPPSPFFKLYFINTIMFWIFCSYCNCFVQFIYLPIKKKHFKKSTTYHESTIKTVIWKGNQFDVYFVCKLCYLSKAILQPTFIQKYYSFHLLFYFIFKHSDLPFDTSTTSEKISIHMNILSCAWTSFLPFMKSSL